MRFDECALGEGPLGQRRTVFRPQQPRLMRGNAAHFIALSSRPHPLPPCLLLCGYQTPEIQPQAGLALINAAPPCSLRAPLPRPCSKYIDSCYRRPILPTLGTLTGHIQPQPQPFCVKQCVQKGRGTDTLSGCPMTGVLDLKCSYTLSCYVSL